MSSYNDYDGEPVSGSYHFLTEILRQQWGFKGYVVSDSEAVEFLHTKHRITPTEEEMAAQVVNAGLNIRTNFTPPQDFILPLRRAIDEGKVSLHTLDQRVSEILRVKFMMGLLIIRIPVMSVVRRQSYTMTLIKQYLWKPLWSPSFFEE